ncbi:MAG: S49 family peptidase, partial [Polaromonas sp.]|nr:S49 family peptidase [Polaromonas sp.]
MNDSNRTDPSDNPDFDPNRPPAQQTRAQTAPENVATSKSLSTEPGWERATLEKLAFASLNEQKATRRWKTFVRLSWLAFFVFLVWFVMHRSTATSVSAPHTAVVEIKGEIADGADASAEFVNAALRAAFEDEGAQAVVLLINSPGGSPVQAGMMNDEIVRLKAKHKKPV